MKYLKSLKLLSKEKQASKQANKHIKLEIKFNFLNNIKIINLYKLYKQVDMVCLNCETLLKHAKREKIVKYLYPVYIKK